MIIHKELPGELGKLSKYPCAPLAQLPTPIHPLENFTKHLNGPEAWIKRDDLTGLPGGGNKTRKLEFLVGDAVTSGYDMLVTVGAIRSNHARQTAAAAAKANMKCALLYNAWTEDAGPYYRKTGNVLISSIMGAQLYIDETVRPIEDDGPLEDFKEYLEAQGHKPYIMPGGASEHKLGSLGYMACAAEIHEQCKEVGVHFDYVVHCSGSSSTQAGLVAGFAALGEKTHVIGIADDYETEIKKERVLKLANDSLEMTEIEARVKPDDIEVHSFDKSPYGVTEPDTFDAMYLFSQSEGLLADPVYEGKAIRGLLELTKNGRFEKDSRILFIHLGGNPAIHAYANQYNPVELTKIPF
jgi:1-aminocyclopropane-1-carboxylate deaminase